MGGHLHRLSDTLAPPPPKHLPTHPAFDQRQRAAVIEWLLANLTLAKRHFDHLRSPQRRLDPDQIDRRRYRSWPSSRERAILAGRAMDEFGLRIYRFPGFYIDQNERPMFNGPPGLLLPVSDPDEQIVGLQIRPNDPSLGKRMWLSSFGRSGGTGSGAPAHFSFPGYVRDPFTAYVIEGVLNADISSDLIGSLCVGIAGKTNWRAIDRRELRLGLIENVIIALDEDPDDDITNRRALREFFARDFYVRSARWDRAQAKGFDDLLNAEGWFETTEGL